MQIHHNNKIVASREAPTVSELVKIKEPSSTANYLSQLQPSSDGKKYLNEENIQRFVLAEKVCEYVRTTLRLNNSI